MLVLLAVSSALVVQQPMCVASAKTPFIMAHDIIHADSRYASLRQNAIKMSAAAVVQSVISGSTFIKAGLTPADEFRFGSGGPVSLGGGAVIGFQGGTGHGNGNDAKMGIGPSHDDFRFGSGGPVSRGGGSAIGFQGGTGRGTGADIRPVGASFAPDDFRFGSGRAATGFQSKYVGYAGNGGAASDQLGTAISIVERKLEDVSGSVVSTGSKKAIAIDEVDAVAEAKVAAPA